MDIEKIIEKRHQWIGLAKARYGLSRADVEDCFSIAIQQILETDRLQKPESWLRKRLYSRCSDKLRSLKKEKVNKETYGEWAKSTEPEDDKKLEALRLLIGLGAVSTETFLRYLKDMPINEVAETLNLSKETLKKRLGRDKIDLRKEIILLAELLKELEEK